MFYYLSGSVAEIEPGLAVIDCGGVGYACATTNYTLAQLTKGERAQLYTYMNINTNAKDDVVELFGFASQSELKSFKMLINVNGVGPRAALSILSSTTPSSLATSIITEDEKALTAAPGIGKKIAQRIILELKDKLAKEQNVVGFSDIQGVGVAASATKSKASEASAALSVLGYGSQEIASALRGIDMDKLSLEEIIRQALKQMVR